MVTILVLFDFSKALDCITHMTLLTKLQRMGISGLPLRFFNNLQGRQQAVRITRARCSGCRPISSDVPQISVLGPLLFGLFSTDLPRMLTHCRKYADDTQIYYQALPSKLDNSLGLIDRDVQAVSDWDLNNGLELST